MFELNLTNLLCIDRNVSQGAADFIARIEEALSQASTARQDAQQTIDNTKFIVTAVETALEKVAVTFTYV